MSKGLVFNIVGESNDRLLGKVEIEEDGRLYLEVGAYGCFGKVGYAHRLYAALREHFAQLGDDEPTAEGLSPDEEKLRRQWQDSYDEDVPKKEEMAGANALLHNTQHTRDKTRMDTQEKRMAEIEKRIARILEGDATWSESIMDRLTALESARHTHPQEGDVEPVEAKPPCVYCGDKRKVWVRQSHFANPPDARGYWQHCPACTTEWCAKEAIND